MASPVSSSSSKTLSITLSAPARLTIWESPVLLRRDSLSCATLTIPDDSPAPSVFSSNNSSTTIPYSYSNNGRQSPSASTSSSIEILEVFSNNQTGHSSCMSPHSDSIIAIDQSPHPSVPSSSEPSNLAENDSDDPAVLFRRLYHCLSTKSPRGQATNPFSSCLLWDFSTDHGIGQCADQINRYIFALIISLFLSSSLWQVNLIYNY